MVGNRESAQAQSLDNGLKFLMCETVPKLLDLSGGHACAPVEQPLGSSFTSGACGSEALAHRHAEMMGIDDHSVLQIKTMGIVALVP